MIRYLTLEEALELHRLALEQSGGLDGVRDLGGHATPDGRVRTGRVFRSDSLAHVNPADVDLSKPVLLTAFGEWTKKDGFYELNGDKLTLRPEATAGIVRAVVEHNALYNGPIRIWTQGAMFRVGATATTKINRRDFGLQYSRMIEGAAIVGDEITLTIDIEATRRG